MIIERDFDYVLLFFLFFVFCFCLSPSVICVFEMRLFDDYSSRLWRTYKYVTFSKIIPLLTPDKSALVRYYFLRKCLIYLRIVWQEMPSQCLEILTKKTKTPLRLAKTEKLLQLADRAFLLSTPRQDMEPKSFVKIKQIN